MQTPRLTSNEIVEIQQEICHLMALAGEEQEPQRLMALDGKVEELYELLGDEAEDKLARLRAVARRIEAEAEMLKQEAAVISRARKSHARSLERVKSWATSLMIGLAETKGTTKLSVDGRSFWLAKTWKLDGPKEASEWPQEWLRTVTKTEPDKAAAKAALKAGADVPDGFAWEQVEGIRWR